MSLDRLVSVIPPPEEPVHTGARTEWKAIQKAVGTKLPEDFYEFGKTYGTGDFFCGELGIYNPFDPSYERCIDVELQRIREMKESFPEEVPYPIFPEPRGLFPLGSDDNGNTFFWLTDEDPEKWTIICKSESYHWEDVRQSLPDFLVLLVTNKLNIQYDQFWGNPYFSEGDKNFRPRRPKPASKRKRKKG